MSYYFIGIKGSGMSSLAQIMYDLGYKVLGSDVEKYFFTQIELEKRNILLLNYNSNNINNNLIIVKGNSIKDDNVELIKSKSLNLKIYTYFEMLNEIINKHYSIGISGCHGKTTTTALLSKVFEKVGTNYLIGDGTGFANKKNKNFIFEACEYKRHFLNYFPNVSIITNIELDHYDYYKSLKDLKKAYIDYLNQNKKYVMLNGDDKNVLSILKDLKVKYYLYGIKNTNDFFVKNIKYKTDSTSFDFYYNNKLLTRINTKFFGKHMVYNTLSAISVGFLENISLDNIQDSLFNFKNAKRRFNEIKTKTNIIIDDYAHHPTEIKAVINSVKQKYKDKKIIGVFLPHTFSRTKALYKKIAKELNRVDKSYIFDIYKSREKQEDYIGVTSNLILDLLNNKERFNIELLKKEKNSVIIFMSPDDMKEYIEVLKQEDL